MHLFISTGAVARPGAMPIYADRIVSRQHPKSSPGSGRRPPLAGRHRITSSETISTVVVCAILTAVTGAIASSGEVDGWERSVLLWFNRWPDWLEPPLWVIQMFGLLGAPVVVAAVVWLVLRRTWTTMAFVAVVPLKLLFEKGIVKQIVERERPAVSVGAVVQVRGPAVEGLSFPSGHATTAFATAVLLMAIVPRRWRPLPILWAAAVALARMYMGEHNLLDVVAGAAIGTGYAVVLWYLMLNRDLTEQP